MTLFIVGTFFLLIKKFILVIPFSTPDKIDAFSWIMWLVGWSNYFLVQEVLLNLKLEGKTFSCWFLVNASIWRFSVRIVFQTFQLYALFQHSFPQRTANALLWPWTSFPIIFRFPCLFLLYSYHPFLSRFPLMLTSKPKLFLKF